VQRSGEVRLSVLHATASTSTAAITAPVADWANCLVIAVRLPVQFSYFVHVGENLSYTHSIVWQAFSCHICRRFSRKAAA